MSPIRFAGAQSRALFLCSHLQEPCLQNQVRHLAAQYQLPVINVPTSMANRMKHLKRKHKKQEKMDLVKRSQRGDMSVPVISCKRAEYNYYRGQVYDKFSKVPLVSNGWMHRKSVGDYFTINSYGSNPASSQDIEGHQTFNSLGINPGIVASLEKMGYIKPTNIQGLGIPTVMEGKNTLIAAETGNGKTLTFLIPMMQQILESQHGKEHLPFNSPLGLIIAPGRELAEQIKEVATTLGNQMGINVGFVTGGKIKKKILYPTMTTPHILVATIGALSKLTSAGIYKTQYLKHLVLDEADTLLDDSFNDAVVRYLSKFSIQGASSDDDQQPLVMSGIQLTFVAATVPRSLHTILDPILDINSLVKVSTPQLHRIMPHVPQKFLRVNNRIKPEKLLELAKKDARTGVPVVIFSNNSVTSDWVSLFLNENDVPCVNLNGNMSAELRRDKFNTFQSGNAVAISCTDLMSRGLDTIRARHVINYEFPTYVADYIHRAGRTGRVGSTGNALITNFIHRRDEIELTQKIEYAARKVEELPNVNANIKRIITARAAKEDGIPEGLF